MRFASCSFSRCGRCNKKDPSPVDWSILMSVLELLRRYASDRFEPAHFTPADPLN
jgi:hypothetical protein